MLSCLKNYRYSFIMQLFNYHSKTFRNHWGWEVGLRRMGCRGDGCGGGCPPLAILTFYCNLHMTFKIKSSPEGVRVFNIMIANTKRMWGYDIRIDCGRRELWNSVLSAFEIWLNPTDIYRRSRRFDVHIL